MTFFLDVHSVTMVTGVGSGCDLDGNSNGMYIEVSGRNHEHCATKMLDSPGDDFEQGKHRFSDIFN